MGQHSTWLTGWVRCLCILLCIAIIPGCATQATLSAKASSKFSEALREDEGALALRITATDTGLRSPFQYWQTAVLQRLDGKDTGKQYEIQVNTQGASGSATYLGRLPEGAYGLAELSCSPCGGMTTKLTLKSEVRRFQVHRGAITYGGHFAYTRAGQQSGQLIPSATIDVENFKQWLNAYAPNNSDIPVKTNGSKPPTESAFKAIQNEAIGLSHPTTLPNGDVLFTSTSGSLRRFTWTRGALSSINTGMQSRAHALLVLDEQTWLVGGEFNEMRLTTDAGRTWRPYALPIPYGVIRGLYQRSDKRLIAFVQQEKHLSMMVGGLDGKGWESTGEFRFGSDQGSGGSMEPRVWRDPSKPNRIVLIVPEEQSWIVDTDSGSRTPVDFPGAVVMTTLSADDVFRCRCNRTGTWISNWESQDLGKRWQDSSLDRSMALPVFKNRQTGFTSTGFNIQMTTDGGRTWGQVHQFHRPRWDSMVVPYHLTYLFIGPQHILATDGLGELVASTNGGRSWMAVGP